MRRKKFSNPSILLKKGDTDVYPLISLSCSATIAILIVRIGLCLVMPMVFRMGTDCNPFRMNTCNILPTTCTAVKLVIGTLCRTVETATTPTTNTVTCVLCPIFIVINCHNIRYPNCLCCRMCFPAMGMRSWFWFAGTSACVRR